MEMKIYLLMKNLSRFKHQMCLHKTKVFSVASFWGTNLEPDYNTEVEHYLEKKCEFL